MSLSTVHAGITIAIDDRYEVWGSGTISIPWNFSIQDLKPQLLKLLGPATMHEAASSSTVASASLLSEPRPRYPILANWLETFRSQTNRRCLSALTSLGCRLHSMVPQQPWQHAQCSLLRSHPQKLKQGSFMLVPQPHCLAKPQHSVQARRCIAGQGLWPGKVIPCS